MRTKDDILADVEEETIGEVLARARFSFRYFAENVIGVTPIEQKPIDIKDFHEEWVNTVLENRRSCIVASRGLGKTMTLGCLFPLWRMMFHSGEIFLLISPTMSDSKEIISYIRGYTENNEILQQLKPDDENATWTKTELNTSTNCKVFNKPFSERVRGKQVNWVIADELALYDEHDTFFSAVVPTTNRKNGHVVGISTPKHETDLVHKLQDNDAYVFKEYPIKEDGELLYPEEFDEERLQEIKDELGESKFRREYLLEISGGEESPVPFSYIADSFDEDEVFEPSVDDETRDLYFGGDFALSPQGDYTAFTTLEKVDGKFKILDIQRMRGIGEDEQVQKIVDLHERYHYNRLYVDESSFGRSILTKLRNESLPVKGVTFNSKNKKELYNNLVRTINSGKLIIPRGEDSRTIGKTDRLVKELSAIETSKSSTGVKNYKVSSRHDDVADSLALAIQAAQKETSFLKAFSARNTRKDGLNL